MRYITELMDKVFSDSTPQEYRDAVERCFAEAAAANGKIVTVKTPQGDLQGVLKDDGTVEITDGNNGEVTSATKDSDGNVKLTGNPANDMTNQQAPSNNQQTPPQTPNQDQGQTKSQCKTRGYSSATQPDAVVPTPDYKGKGLDVTTERNRPTESDSIQVSIEEAITDPDKAGMHKNFSLVFSGFSSQEEAEQAFSEMNNMYSDMDEYEQAFSDIQGLTEDSLTFSESEIGEVLAQREYAEQLSQRIEGLKSCDPVQCAGLASELRSMSDTVKAYSVLAENMGYDMSDTIEQMNAYSEYANEALDTAYANMDINEYFSDFDEDSLNEYFSNLGEVESQVLYSALEDEENTYTFSEIDEAIDKVYSNLALEQNVNAYFSEASEDEVNAFFSDLNDDEMNAVYSVLEDENATFSDVNAAIELANTPLVQLFSNASDEEIATFSKNIGEDLADIAFSMAKYDENATYSDFVNFANELCTFSDEDEGKVVENVQQLAEAAHAIEGVEDPAEQMNLTRKVKVLCASTSAMIPENCDNETLLYCKATCDQISEYADNVLYSHGISGETFDEIDTDGDGEISKEEWKAAGGNPEVFDVLDTDHDGEVSRAEFEVADTNHDGIISKDEMNEIMKNHCDSCHSDTDLDDVTFSDAELKNLESLYSDQNFETDETRVFAKVNGEEGYSTINPCLTSVIN